jgi:Phospholipase_D-nuclease N-terminal
VNILPLASQAAVPPHHPLAHLLPALLPVVVLALAFDVYCLTDLVRAKSVRYLPKFVWGVIILLVSSPLGAVLYLLLGRDRNSSAEVPG